MKVKNTDRQKRQCLVISKFLYTFAVSNNDKEIINDLKNEENMDYYTYKVELNGDSFLFRTYVILNVYERDDE